MLSLDAEKRILPITLLAAVRNAQWGYYSCLESQISDAQKCAQKIGIDIQDNIKAIRTISTAHYLDRMRAYANEGDTLGFTSHRRMARESVFRSSDEEIDKLYRKLLCSRLKFGYLAEKKYEDWEDKERPIEFDEDETKQIRTCLWNLAVYKPLTNVRDN